MLYMMTPKKPYFDANFTIFTHLQFSELFVTSQGSQKLSLRIGCINNNNNNT